MRAASNMSGPEKIEALYDIADKDDAMDNASHYLHGGVDGEVSPNRDEFGDLQMSPMHNAMSTIRKLKTKLPKTGYMEPVLKWIQENPERAMELAKLPSKPEVAVKHPNEIAKILLADFDLETLRHIIATEDE